MRKVFTLVGGRGINPEDPEYNEGSVTRGYGSMNGVIETLTKRNDITIHSLSYTTTALPLTRPGMGGVAVHFAATIVYEGEITDPIGEPTAYPDVYSVNL